MSYVFNEADGMNYQDLTDRDLDAAIAERVMGWTLVEDLGTPMSWWKKPTTCALVRVYDFRPSTDDNAARLVRDRIEGLKLESRFMQILGVLIGECEDSVRDSRALVSIGIGSAFDWLQATPRQQCIAALLALDTQAPKGAPK